MADARAVIDIDINTSDAAAGLRSLQAQISAFNSTLTKSSAVQATAMRNSRDNLLELVNASRFFSAETVKMQTGAASLDKTLSKGQATLGQYFKSFKRGSLESAQVMSLANTRAQALQTQFVATGAAANGMREAVAIRPLQAFNNAATVSAQKLAIQRAMLTQATTSMINFGKNTQWAGRQLMVGFTVPLSIFGAMAGKTFMDLEKQIVNFRKVYGDAMTPPEELEQNINAVKELAKEYTKYGIAVKDTIGLAAEAAAAGAQNKDLIDATTQATRLATLGQMEQNQALDTTISLQNAFKLSGDELAKSINFLNMVENQTVVTLQDLSAAIPRVAPVIKGLGGNVEDLAAFLAAMQEGGVSAEQGANALKSGLASLINPTEKAKETLTGLGISLDAIIQTNRGDLMGTVQGFADALDTLDTFQRQQALEQVFGKFQYARLGALFDNINKDGTQASRVLEMVGMSAGEMAASAEKELSAIEESAGTKLTAAMERLQLAIAPIGEMFVKMATPVLGFLASVAEKFNNLPDFAKNFAGLAAVIVGVVIPTGTMFLGLLMNLIGTLIKFGSIVGIAFKGFVSGGFSGAFKAVSQSLRYMSLEEIDAANAAQQLAGSTQAVNTALMQQIGPTELATAAVGELAYAYQVLAQQMQEAALMNDVAFGTGAAAMGAARSRGPIVRRNTGGTIPGSGNTDTVPAMLTPGEFVINKQATQKNLPLLKQINEGGKVPGYSFGGLIARIFSSASRRRSTTPIVPNIIEPKPSARQAISPASSRGLTNQISLANDQPISSTDTYSGPMHNAHMTSRKQVSLPSPFIPDSDAATEWLMREIPGTTKKARVARELARRGLFGGSLSNDTLGLPAIINDAARSGSTQPLTLLQAAQILELPGAVKVTSNTAMSSNGLFPVGTNSQLGRQMASQLREMARTSGNVQITDFALSEARNAAIADIIPLVRQQTSYPYAGVIQSRELQRVLSVQGLEDLDQVNSLLRQKGYSGVSLLPPSRKGGKVRIQVGGDIEELGAQDKIKTETGPSLIGLNNGNIVPGTGNKDTVPAMLTPGEFVVNKQATQSNRALLEAINNGNVKGYELGGIVEAMPGQYLVEGRNGRTFGPMSYRDAIRRSKQLVSARARRGMVSRGGSTPNTGMGAGRGMGMGMGMGAVGGAMMMAPMIPGVGENAALSTAASAGGIGLSMLSMLPMMGVGGPVTLAIAGVAAAATAAGVAIYKWRDSVDTASRQAADFGANLGGTANALNNISEMMGQQTPAQRQAQLSLSQEDKKILDENAQQFQNIFASEKGQKFVQELSNATSSDRFKKLSDYLKYAIASGLLDTRTAQAFAKGISSQIGDSVLGTQVSTAIKDQESGPSGIIDLAEKRIEDSSIVISRALNETALSHEDASKTIGAATQIIQDFANAEALAREQFMSGQISYEEMQDVINQANDAQSKYNDAIEAAISKTNDFGGTMQATIDQMIKAGLLSEDQFKELESKIYSEKVSLTPQEVQAAGQPGGIGAEQALRQKEYAQAAGEEIVGVKFDPNELMSAAISSISSDMSAANAIAIAEKIATGSGPAYDIYKSEVDAGKSGVRAFESVGAAEAISSMVKTGGGYLPGLMGSVASETAKDISIRFASDGGDVTALQKVIASLPEDGTARYDFLVEFDLLSSEQKSRMLADTEKLSAMFGEEFANSLTASNDYKKALENGTTGIFTSNMERAKSIFGEAARSIIEYSQKTTTPLSQLTQYGKELSDLPQDLIFRAGIDIENPEDLKLFGPMADQLQTAWPTLAQLPEGIDVRAVIEANTLENGQLKPIGDIVDSVTKANKAMKDLDSTKPSIVKNAVINLMVMQGATQTDAESAFNTVIAEMENFNKFDLQSKSAIVRLIVHKIDLQEKFDNAADALASTNSINAGGGADLYVLSTTGQQIAEADKALDAEVAAAQTKLNINGGGNSSGGSSGGGTPEKTIAETIAEQRKLITDQEKFLMSGKGKTVAAGPFGREFIEYLKSQGEKGVELMKEPLKKIQKIQKDFAISQRKEIRIASMAMPEQMAKDLKARKKRVELADDLVSSQNISLDVATEIANSLDNQQVLDYIKLKSQSDLNKSQKNYLTTLESIVDESKKSIEYNKENLRIEKYRAMTADERRSAEIDNAQTINDLQRQIAEIQILQPLQDQLDAQQKIADGINRTIELRQRDADAIGRTIELEQRKIEPIDKAISKYEEEISAIEDNYNAQLDALDEVAKKEEENASLRKSRLDLASAISRGDVSSAAAIAMRIRNEQAANRREDTRAALERSRELEIEEIQERIKKKEEEREAIQERINSLQLDQRKIQDDIYTLQQSLIPVNDEIFRINEDIRKEAEKLDDQYNNAKLQVEALKQQLKEAKLEAEALARASAAAGAAPSAPSGGLPPASSYESGSYQGATQSASVAAQFDQSVLANAAKLNAAAAAGKDVTKLGFTKSDWQALSELEAANKAAGLMYGGQAKKYAMGGLVSYKGSTEPAPGFMMGGQIKKYAFGSYVPGRGMTDKVPAMLTPGEFVVRKSVAQQMMPQLMGLNSQVFPGMKKTMSYSSEQFDKTRNIRDYLPKFNVPIIPSINSSPSNFTNNVDVSLPPINNVQYTYNINVAAETNASPDDIADTVIRKIRLQDNSNVRSYNFRGR